MGYFYFEFLEQLAAKIANSAKDNHILAGLAALADIYSAIVKYDR